jgi:hypothetical protein
LPLLDADIERELGVLGSPVDPLAVDGLEGVPAAPSPIM